MNNRAGDKTSSCVKEQEALAVSLTYVKGETNERQTTSIAQQNSFIFLFFTDEQLLRSERTVYVANVE